MKKKARQTVGAIFCRPSGARAAAPPQCRRRLTAEKTVETIFAFCITHLIFSCRQAPALQPCLLRPLGSDMDTKAKVFVILIGAITNGCAIGLAMYCYQIEIGDSFVLNTLPIHHSSLAGHAHQKN